MTRHPVLFVTHRGERHQHNALASAPAELAITIRRNPERAELVQLIPDFEFLISERTGVIDAELIAAGRQLKLIQRLGSQTWDIDLNAARRAGVAVCSLPLRTCSMVAEHMLLQLLATARRIRELMQITSEAGPWATPRRCDEDYFAYNWSDRRNVRELSGSTVGILGFGEIGVELVRRLSGYDCTILYAKRNRLPAHAESALGLEFASQADLFRRSDFVCSLLPLFPETHQSLNAAAFSQMKPGALFVHCGAGGVVDQAALIAALRSGHLAGAALDTFEWEPLPPDDPLLELARDPQQNLILTPHVGSGYIASEENSRTGDYANIAAWLQGQPLRHRLV